MPSWMMELGPKIQIFEDRAAVRGLIRIFAGHASPTYQQVDWLAAEEFRDIYERPTQLPIAEPDTKASVLAMIPRFKKRAVVVASDRRFMHEIHDRQPEVKPAVAIEYKDTLMAGVFPGGMDDLGTDHPDAYTAALRMGRSPMGVGLGFWRPEDGVILIPEDLWVLKQRLEISDVPKKFPDTPLT